MINERDIEDEEINENQDPPIIIDAGSWIKIDHQGANEIPRTIFPTIIAACDSSQIHENKIDSTQYVGLNATHQSTKEPSLDFRFPIECGLPLIKEDADLIYSYAFEQLNIDPCGKKIAMGQKSLFPQKFSKQNSESMFEKFEVEGLQFINTDVVTTMAHGRLTALIVDMGTSQTMIVPILEGVPQKYAIKRMEIGGRDITELLQRAIETRNKGTYKFRTANEIDIIRQLKEKACKLVSEWDGTNTRDIYRKQERRYELPDGEEITLGISRIECPEVLFDPERVGSSRESSLPRKIYESIREVDILARRDLYQNIILTGGTSMVTGLKERLKSELQKLVNPSVKIKIVTQPGDVNRKYDAWRYMNTFLEIESSANFVTKDEYNEYGSNILFRK